ncbi:LysR family transcriptional regulator [Methylobacterium aerolatum]|uniref:DNA-binding transcriptional LysR family regulator n=1 Tax=Methylobacterium aerolatum TaxID=418708 RepID=A0ABU0I5V7_9HYPH|nr:LysR family transcriptional regulator [Methylobacterium aerolatum]MDQ0449009.1 DNA-binding transcriptional LysR family regulator [Methylobacterium aerolatum]GJD35197.1 HTH-type transcriptional regulator HdfR [Methylobacterium aerolatum]
MQASWDDFRFVKVVADRQGLTGAAEALGIDHSTAFRRLGAIEKALGVPLFERHRGGYTATAAGQAMLAVATRMEADVDGFSREVVGRSDVMVGELRITAPTSFAGTFLMPILADFSRRHPAVRLELILAEETLNLSRRDADVALRASRGPDETLVGRRLTGVGWALYGAAGQTFGRLGDERWVGLGESVAGGLFARFLARRVSPDRIALSLNGVAGLREAVAAGIGIGPLPCIEGDADARLRRLGDVEPELHTDLWLLTHQDLRRSARVRAFMDHVAAAMLPLRPLFEGRGGIT